MKLAFVVCPEPMYFDISLKFFSFFFLIFYIFSFCLIFKDSAENYFSKIFVFANQKLNKKKIKKNKTTQNNVPFNEYLKKQQKSKEKILKSSPTKFWSEKKKKMKRVTKSVQLVETNLLE